MDIDLKEIGEPPWVGFAELREKLNGNGEVILRRWQAVVMPNPHTRDWQWENICDLDFPRRRIIGTYSSFRYARHLAQKKAGEFNRRALGRK